VRSRVGTSAPAGMWTIQVKEGLSGREVARSAGRLDVAPMQAGFDEAAACIAYLGSMSPGSDRQVCQENIALDQAQQEIVKDWIT
jgi:hypothetical protein